MAAILVIDSDPVSRASLVHALAPLGEVEQASSGVDGLRLLATKRFTVALVDLHVRPLDGFVILRTVRARGGPNQDTPLYAIAADSAEQARAIREHAVFALMKPFSPATVHNLVDASIRKAEDAQVKASTVPPPASKRNSNTLPPPTPASRHPTPPVPAKRSTPPEASRSSTPPVRHPTPPVPIREVTPPEPQRQPTPPQPQRQPAPTLRSLPGVPASPRPGASSDKLPRTASSDKLRIDPRAEPVVPLADQRRTSSRADLRAEPQPSPRASSDKLRIDPRAEPSEPPPSPRPGSSDEPTG